MKRTTAQTVLLTVSGEIPPDVDACVARGERPRADYVEMAHGFGADLLDYVQAEREAGVVGRLLRRVGGRNAVLAWACWRRRAGYRVIVTDGEQVGIPLALLLKTFGRGARDTQHAMIVHTLSVPKKTWILDWLKIHSHIDRFLVYASWQQRFIVQRWNVAQASVVLTPFMVDDRFFEAEHVTSSSMLPPMICAVGLERRDYPTLMDAVRGLPVQVVIAAASPWSKQGDSTGSQAVPDNVRVSRFTQFELRQLYADSAFMVMPLQDVTFQAGVTAILEAMAMERAVICSRTPGQTDVIVDGETGVYVPPKNAVALRAAITSLLADPDAAARMGRRGRALVEQRLNLDAYVERLTVVVRALAQSSGPIGR